MARDAANATRCPLSSRRVPWLTGHSGRSEHARRPVRRRNGSTGSGCTVRCCSWCSSIGVLQQDTNLWQRLPDLRGQFRIARRLPGSKASAPARSARSTGSAASSRAKSSCERLEARRRLLRPCSTSPLRRSAGKTFDLLKMVGILSRTDFMEPTIALSRHGFGSQDSYPIAIRQSYQQG